MVEGGFKKLFKYKTNINDRILDTSEYLDMWFEGLGSFDKISFLWKSLGGLAEIIEHDFSDYKKVMAEYTPKIKELKEKYKDKNPKHFTIQDNKG